MKSRAADDLKSKVPSIHNWKTTDEEEIARRRLRAHTEQMRVRNLDPRYPVFSSFAVKSASGLSYTVEIRSVSQRRFSCTCVDFRINELGTCKHVEAVLLYLESRHRTAFRRAQSNGAGRIEVVPDHICGTLRVEGIGTRLVAAARKLIDAQGRITGDDLEQSIERLRSMLGPDVRVSQEVGPWLEARRRLNERKLALREYEQKVLSGEWPAYETLVPLYPYQREGMLHLAFQERAMLADEMGLGKTVQAIAACALLHRLGKAARVLVVTPASLKTEWEEQIQRFTRLPYQLVFGGRQRRLRLYPGAPFFTIANYEQMLRDALDVNERLHPDVVILDEAQRIKNWDTRTAQAVKRLRSRYAWILTGTPIENRIDEIHSLMAFLDPSVLGPLFRFNRDFYQLDERGRPEGYRNLEQLHARIRPFMLRRRKSDVETELPGRTDRTFFVPMTAEQWNCYRDHEAIVARLADIAKRRPLTQQEQEKLMRELSMMRMICDTNYILDPEDRACPKLGELAKILEECRENPDVKVLVFSEWVRMLELVRERCGQLGIGYALHTGQVPQRRRRAEIQLFKTDPDCRVFLTTDSGGTGLNLQAASVVVNCDLPWNPARLEQRIARAWRKHQTRAVTVIHLVSEGTIEHRMLGTLSSKRALADGVLDLRGDLSAIRYRGGRQAFLARLEQLMGPAAPATAPAPKPKPLPVDRSLAFSQAARETLGSALIRCEERYPLDGAHSVVVVVVAADAPLWGERLREPFDELFSRNGSDPLAPVRLEVIDRASDEAIRRLIDSGLLSPATRAIRELFSLDAADSGGLSETEREKAAAHRRQAERKLKMASLLGNGGLTEEQRDALLQAALWLARALAVENRSPEPESLEDSFRPPLAMFWGGFLPEIRGFAKDPSLPATPVAEGLHRLAGTPGEM
jgi:superfamily II DNA or RNA helicase